MVQIHTWPHTTPSASENLHPTIYRFSPHRHRKDTTAQSTVGAIGVHGPQQKRGVCTKVARVAAREPAGRERGGRGAGPHDNDKKRRENCGRGGALRIGVVQWRCDLVVRM